MLNKRKIYDADGQHYIWETENYGIFLSEDLSTILFLESDTREYAESSDIELVEDETDGIVNSSSTWTIVAQYTIDELEKIVTYLKKEIKDEMPKM